LHQIYRFQLTGKNTNKTILDTFCSFNGCKRLFTR